MSADKPPVATCFCGTSIKARRSSWERPEIRSGQLGDDQHCLTNLPESGQIRRVGGAQLKVKGEEGAGGGQLRLRLRGEERIEQNGLNW